MWRISVPDHYGTKTYILKIVVVLYSSAVERGIYGGSFKHQSVLVTVRRHDAGRGIDVISGRPSQWLLLDSVPSRHAAVSMLS